ncbi:Mu transposase C-terminal domain-containing protein [Streptomyces sp. NPDC048330]|uniref:Mu transposase C-terminal domain-containing protein n=1 Tax=Streptomyces sp. NPDC048330 TaxID=3365533 RepID=UPI00371142F9
MNRAVESMFLAALPGYARQARPGKRSSRLKDEVLLGFEDFTAQLLDWTRWWNTEHRPAPLQGRTPLHPWQDDPTPLRDVPATDLWTFTLEDAGTRTLTTRGIRFRKRDYVGPWMNDQTGIQVRIRFMPHHDHRIEVYHADTGRYLGPADLADQATDELLPARAGMVPLRAQPVDGSRTAPMTGRPRGIRSCPWGLGLGWGRVWRHWNGSFSGPDFARSRRCVGSPPGGLPSASLM